MKERETIAEILRMYIIDEEERFEISDLILKELNYESIKQDSINYGWDQSPDMMGK